MKYQLKNRMAAKCANAKEMRSVINAIKEAGIYKVAKKAGEGTIDDYPHLSFFAGILDQWTCNEEWKFVPLHEFILRGIGQWAEEPNELTLEVAKELLEECAICIDFDRDQLKRYGVKTLAENHVLDKLSEYGIKP